MGKAARPLSQIEMMHAKDAQEKAGEERRRLVLGATAILAAEVFALVCW